VHAAFGDFAEALKAEPAPTAVAAADSLIEDVDAFFTSDTHGEGSYHHVFCHALAGLFPAAMMPVRLREGSMCATDGTVMAAPFALPVVNLVARTLSDPTAENEATYLHLVTNASAAVRLVERRLHMHPAVLTALRTLPCFLLNVHAGSVLEVRGAVLAGAGMISEPLASAPLRGTRGGPGAEALARLLHACVVGATALTATHTALVRDDARPFVAVPVPSLASILRPLQLADGRRVKCRRDLSVGTPKPVFEATVLSFSVAAASGGGGSQTAATGVAAGRKRGKAAAVAAVDRGALLVIKLARERYGAEAHQVAAAAGHAPDLHCVTPLSARLLAVAMDLLVVREGAWQLYYAAAASTATKAAVTAAYMRAFTHKGVEYVHGDLRYGNVFIRTDAATGRVTGVMFIDFDWAGRAGEARYPATMNVDVWRDGGPPDAQPGTLLAREPHLPWLQGSDELPLWDGARDGV